MDGVWQSLYEAARAACCPRTVSDYVQVGGVGAAVLSASGKIYTGVCVATASTLGICAERSALFHMLANGESAFVKVVAVDWEGRVLPPCGACRELMVQLMPQTYSAVEVLVDGETAVSLADLTPRWWIS